MPALAARQIVARAGAAAALGVLAVAMTGACGDRQISPPIDWPAPERITQRIDRDHCIALEGGLKCWAPGIKERTLPTFDEDAALMLMARDELLPGPPLPFVELGSDARVLGSATRSSLSRCAALEAEGVKCWGSNVSHDLGLPDPAARIGDAPEERGAALPFVDLGSVRDIVSVDAASEGGYCALFRSGKVKCWGWNDRGSLGLGDSETRGDDPGEMGDALPFLDLGTDVRAVGLSGSCIWTEDGRVKCWGDNAHGQLGVMSDPPPAPDPGDVEDMYPEPWGEPLGDEPGEMGDALPFVDLGDNAFVVQVAKAETHTCALTDDGRVRCWGANCHRLTLLSPPENCGRLGQGDKEDLRPPLGDELAYVDLGTDAKAVAIDAHFEHTCALLDDGRLKCWGATRFNDDLGLDVGDDPGEMGDALPPVDVGSGRTVRAFRCGAEDTCALLDDDSIQCWGGRGGGVYPDPDDDDYNPVVTHEELFGDGH